MAVAETEAAARQAWLGLLAKAPSGAVSDRIKGAKLACEHEFLRKPEICGVMVRGRAGATGDAFNLGEMTVTRCSLRLPTGEVGHGYVQGRGKDDCAAAALVDALMQTSQAAVVRRAVLDPLAAEAAERKAKRAAKAAATKVEFFTLVRGEN